IGNIAHELQSLIVCRRLNVAFAVCVLISTGHGSSCEVPMARPPELPVVTRNVLPGEGWVQGPVKLSHSIVIYDSWRVGRQRIAAVRAGTTVTLLGGLNIVYKPDEIVV